MEISGFTDAQNTFIQQQHKELLEFARVNNDNKEVAFVFRKGLTARSVFKGSDDKLDFGSALVGKGDELFLMHNHPRNSSYSFRDIFEFITNKNIKTISIVKNNGKIEVLTKVSKCDNIQMARELKCLKKRYVKIGSNEEYQKVVNKYINNHVERGDFEWIR